MLNARTRWLAGRYANVDGIPFRMPVETKSSPAMFAAFSVDADAAQKIVPGQELYIAKVLRRAIMIVAVVNYGDTAIGKYVETCIGFVCVHRRVKPMPLLPLAMPFLYGTGVYIYDLPVSTQISVKGGLGIWGMPKRQGNLDFLIGDDTVSSQYDFEGETVIRLDVPRKSPWMPFFMAGKGYGSFRGMLTKSRISGSGRAGITLGGKGTSLLVGDHPRAAPLRDMDISTRALFSAFVPSFKGVLDDHIETWFETADCPPPLAPDSMADVIDLGLSEEWLAPPNRQRTDAMLQSWSPEQRVGKVSRPNIQRA